MVGKRNEATARLKVVPSEKDETVVFTAKDLREIKQESIRIFKMRSKVLDDLQAIFDDTDRLIDRCTKNKIDWDED